MRRLHTIIWGHELYATREYPAIIETGPACKSCLLEVSSHSQMVLGAREQIIGARTVALPFTHITHSSLVGRDVVTFPREMYTSLKNGGSHHHRTRESQPCRSQPEFSCASSNTRATAPLRLKVPPPLPRAGTSLSSVQWRMCVKPSSSLGRERLALMRRTMPCTLDAVTFGSGDKARARARGKGDGPGLWVTG